MFKQKRRSKQEPKDTTKEDETKVNPYKGQLFSEADAKSMELSGYSSPYGVNQSGPLTSDRNLPVGVVGIDKSVKFPPISPKSNAEGKTHVKTDQEQPSQPVIKYPSFNPSNSNNFRPRLYASPIASDNSQFVQIYPYNDQSSTPRSHRHSHHKHNHHHHHHHHHHSHRRHQHHHLQNLETHDPRWWYLPSGTVHGPRPNQSPFYAHYEPPRWYEPSSSRGKFVIDTQSFGQTVRLYDDCRCEVCRPSRKTPRGYRWVVHQ